MVHRCTGVSRYLGPAILFSKLNELFFEILEPPKHTHSYNRQNYFLGWPNRYIGFNGNAGPNVRYVGCPPSLNRATRRIHSCQPRHFWLFTGGWICNIYITHILCMYSMYMYNYIHIWPAAKACWQKAACQQLWWSWLHDSPELAVIATALHLALQSAIGRNGALCLARIALD